MGFATFQFLRGTDRNRSNPSPIPMSKRLGAKWSLQCCIHVLLSPKLIKGSQNPIITKVQCLKSYYNKVHVRNPIIAKRNVWRVIIANFSSENMSSFCIEKGLAPKTEYLSNNHNTPSPPHSTCSRSKS
jgi:hypothetical protein